MSSYASGYNQRNINLDGGGGGGLSASNQTFSVNSASVDTGYGNDSIVLRTGAAVNPAGAFTGGGIGNKSIFGVFGFNQLPMGSLSSLDYVWNNIVGPGGPFFIPPGGPSVQTPYVNIIVDFDPLGAGDIRILVTNDDSLAAPITASIGTYVNNGSNVLTYGWTNAQNVIIIGSGAGPGPGGVPPSVSVGPGTFDNSYSWAALVAANPAAVLVNAYPADGGLPAGAIMPAILLASGDSANVTRSGKRIQTFNVNGNNVLA